MQEKIRQFLVERYGYSKPALGVDYAAEIAALFERKVIWEGEARIYDIGEKDADKPGPSRYQITVQGSDNHQFTSKIIAFDCPSKRVRVIVEDIDESRT